MLSFTGHQRNTNPDHSEIHLPSMRMAVVKRQIITCVRKDVDKLVPSDTADGNVTWCGDFGR